MQVRSTQLVVRRWVVQYCGEGEDQTTKTAHTVPKWGLIVRISAKLARPVWRAEADLAVVLHGVPVCYNSCLRSVIGNAK